MTPLHPLMQYAIVAAAAALIAFLGTPVTLMVARHLGFTDQPKAHKFHFTPVPLLGGVAIWAGFIGGLMVWGGAPEFFELAAIMAGATAVAILGLIDDRMNLSPRAKLLGQAAAAVAVSVGGIHVQLFAQPLFNLALTVLWIVAITNAMNLQDNMDGLAAGVAAAAAGSFLLLAVLNGQVLVAGLAATILGACLGFLFYNFQPAVTFMGDTGSMLLGFSLAVLGIKLSFDGLHTDQSWMVPVLVLGLPLFDVALVVVSRWRRGVPWWRGGVDHTSHRLVQMGLSHRRAVIALYVVTAVLGLLATAVAYVVTRQLAWVLALSLGAVALLLIYLLEHLWPGAQPGAWRVNLRVAVIGGGAELLPVLEACVTLGRHVSVLLTPAGKNALGWRDIDSERLQQLAVRLSEAPSAAQLLMQSARPLGSALRDQCEVLNSALRMRGRLLANQLAVGAAGPILTASADAMQALQETDLIVIAGDLHENVLATLSLPEVARELRRSKRPRVLVHANPPAALALLKAAGVADVVTHAVAPAQLDGLWYSVTDVADSAQVAQALHVIWVECTKVRGTPQPLAGWALG